jgi:L-threonylcarbamoyladenylate synthase
METKLLPLDVDSLSQGAALIRRGELVAFPTETVYGLGGNALDEAAVARIFAVKGRPADNPLIVHIWEHKQAEQYCHWSEQAQQLADAFWPGPLTLLLPRKPIIPLIVTAGLDTLALRLPSHEGARRFLQACSLPIAAPSANASGRPSPTTAQHVQTDLEGRIPLILDGGPAQVGLESTVLDITCPHPMVLRPGAVTPEQVAMVVGSCDVAPSVMRPLQPGETALSPGMRHRHYAPKAQLSLVEGDREAVAAYICRMVDQQPGARILAMGVNVPLYAGRQVDDLGADTHQAAQRLFYLLRQYDDENVQRVWCEALPPTGLGLAVMNRLARAAQFDIRHAGV